MTEEKKRGGKEKRLMKIVATTSFASSQLLERRPLERRTLVPKVSTHFYGYGKRVINGLESAVP